MRLGRLQSRQCEEFRRNMRQSHVRYVEGFISPVPKKKLSAYRAVHAK
ncbi:MAG: hypothetical protein OJF51_000911 [Nitrospira sp.]|nr:MAG: hypothetical protein OJF51_000911 [Nitrospira sp.]